MNPVRLSYAFEKSFAAKRIVSEGRFDFTDDRLIHALMGPSGIGKSTLARWIVGLGPADRGRLEFSQQTWFDSGASISVRPQLRRVGFMSQSDRVFPHLRVDENIVYGLRRWDRERRELRLQEMLKLSSLESLARRYPSGLSGGEKRRLALAQVLAIEPQLLVLDEPFTGLDDDSKQELWNQTAAWIKRVALPTVLITHDRREATAFSAVVTNWSGSK